MFGVFLCVFGDLCMEIFNVSSHLMNTNQVTALHNAYKKNQNQMSSTEA